MKPKKLHGTDVFLFGSLLARLYPKLRSRFFLSGKNPGFLANTFSTPQIIGEVEKAKLMSYKDFSVSLSVAKKWIKSSLEDV